MYRPFNNVDKRIALNKARTYSAIMSLPINDLSKVVKLYQTGHMTEEECIKLKKEILCKK